MDHTPESYQTIINVLLTLLGLAAGIGVAHFGILRQLNKVKTTVAVHDVQLNSVQTDMDRALESQHQAITLITKVIEQNNLLINQIIVHARLEKEPS